MGVFREAGIWRLLPQGGKVQDVLTVRCVTIVQVAYESPGLYIRNLGAGILASTCNQCRLQMRESSGSAVKIKHGCIHRAHDGGAESAVEVSLAPGLQSLGFLGDENNEFRVRVQMDHTVFTGCKGAERLRLI